MYEKNKLTLKEAKQVIEDYLFSMTGKLFIMDYSGCIPEEIIKIANSLPEDWLKYSKSLDASVEKSINKKSEQPTENE